MRAVLIVVLLVAAAMPARAADSLAPIACMLGTWTGVAEGQPGLSAATRRISRAHDGRYVLAEGRSVYPKQAKNKNGEVHTSSDWWSFDRVRKVLVLRVFDNLGFVSTYVQVRDGDKGKIVMTSEHLENVPAGWKARYTFSCPSADSYHELFELDAGKGFEVYVSGKYLRDKP